MTAQRRLVFQEGNSDKIWIGAVQGRIFEASWGRRGAKLQSKRFEFATDYQAERKYFEMVDSKLSKGYREETAPVNLPNHAPGNSAAQRSTTQSDSVYDGRFGAAQRQRPTDNRLISALHRRTAECQECFDEYGSDTCIRPSHKRQSTKQAPAKQVATPGPAKRRFRLELED